MTSKYVGEMGLLLIFVGVVPWTGTLGLQAFVGLIMVVAALYGLADTFMVWVNFCVCASRFAATQCQLFLTQAVLQVVPVEQVLIANCNGLCNVAGSLCRHCAKYARHCAGTKQTGMEERKT